MSRGSLAAAAIVLALLGMPGVAFAQVAPPPGESAFGPVAPTIPGDAADEQSQVPQQTPPQLPVNDASDETLGAIELLPFVVIEVLLLGALGVAIARDGGGAGTRTRRRRHARRALPPKRRRGATHSRGGSKAPPPPPRRRRAKAGRR